MKFVLIFYHSFTRLSYLILISVTLIYPVFLVCTQHLLQFEHKPSNRNGWTLFFVKNFMEREKSIFTLYTCCMYVLVFQRKPCLRVINKFNCLKDVQNFDTNKSNQKEKKQKRKKKIFSLQLFGHMQHCETF